MFVVTGLKAGKGGVKPDKPGKPGNTQTELIVFTRDLEGSQDVAGCWPNAGPFPAYTMTFDVPAFPALELPELVGNYDGKL